jgi:predicted lysophospholipase L1 biosynthesis ABC-type transport system permease subunit
MLTAAQDGWSAVIGLIWGTAGAVLLSLTLMALTYAGHPAVGKVVAAAVVAIGLGVLGWLLRRALTRKST